MRGTVKETTSIWPLGVSLNMRSISHSPTLSARFGKKQTPRWGTDVLKSLTKWA